MMMLAVTVTVQVLQLKTFCMMWLMVTVMPAMMTVKTKLDAATHEQH